MMWGRAFQAARTYLSCECTSYILTRLNQMMPRKVARCFSTEQIRRYFVDLRVTLALMIVWLSCVLSVFIDMNVSESTPFFRCGPSSTLLFFHTPIDTYFKYNALVTLIIFHVLITDVLSDSLSPNMINVVQNRHIRFLPHTKSVYYAITTVWSVYCQISSIMSIYIAFAQIDLCLVRLGADLIANAFTLSMYLDGKTYDPQRYSSNRPDSPRTSENVSSTELLAVA